jgi:ribosomal protein S12 methylthiotransferase accessory factor
MPQRPQLKHCFHCEVVPSEGVILLSERGDILLRSAIYLQLVPLLDGEHTVHEIVERLRGQSSSAEVFYALDLLQEKGCISDATSSPPSEQAVFWDLLGADPREAVSRLQEATVSVVSFGKIDPLPFQATLMSLLGVKIGNEGSCRVVLTNDYLHDGLGAVNRQALGDNRPWLLVKPVGSELWIGPLFVPRKTGCWSCLAHRLRPARKVESYLRQRRNSSTIPSPPLATLPSTLQTAYSIAASEIAKWIGCGRNEEIEGRIITLDTISWGKQSHQLVRRPQCPNCGDPAAFAAEQNKPLILHSCKKNSSSDGGYRVFAPEETVRKLEHHVSPITGIVSVLQSNTPQGSETSLTPSYVAAHNFAHAPEDASDWDFLLASLRGASGGKGKHPVQAKASALCEAIERYSGVFQGDEARLHARLKDLGAAAIHPNACMLFSEQQFKNRQQWNTQPTESNWVPEPFNEGREIEWSPVWSLTFNEARYIPTAYCYYNYSRQYNTWFARADSNGCAAGRTKEEAILQGFMELVERDSVALWWYNRLRKPTVDLSSFAEPYFQELRAYYKTLHRDLWVLDITNDLNIPTFAAISSRNDKKVEDIIFGFGAHFDPHLAILRALTEVNQSLPAVFSVTPDSDDSYLDDDPKALSWWKTATLENQPYLALDKSLSWKMAEDYQRRWSDDIAADVMACVQIAQAKGLETLVLDQTRPDTGLYVVKVIVPGLRHFWPRFGPGRLYDVPVRMEWLREPLVEDQLNPQSIYF